MKITINADRPDSHVAGAIKRELIKRDMYGTDQEIVLNIDSIYHVNLLKGKKLTLYWEIDDFMMLGNNQDWYLQSDILYINMPEYKLYYPEKAKILRMFCIPEIHYEHQVKKDFDYVFVGSIEPIPVYRDRVILLDKIMRTGVNMMITYGKPENYAELMSRGKIILNILPNTEKNNATLNTRVFESMAVGCAMINDHPFMEKIFKKNVHYITLDRIGNITDQEIERVKLAGRAEVLAKHTVAHRVDQIIKDINELL